MADAIQMGEKDVSQKVRRRMQEILTNKMATGKIKKGTKMQDLSSDEFDALVKEASGDLKDVKADIRARAKRRKKSESKDTEARRKAKQQKAIRRLMLEQKSKEQQKRTFRLD